MVMRALVILLLSAVSANAATYVVQCTAPCVASDGTTQPAGTVLNRIVADPSFNPGAGLALVPDIGQAIYAPPAAPVTSLPLAGFIARFTPTEQQAAASNPATLTLWLLLLANPTIDVTNSQVKGGIAMLQSAGVLTAARGTQILNLSQTSP